MVECTHLKGLLRQVVDGSRRQTGLCEQVAGLSWTLLRLLFEDLWFVVPDLLLCHCAACGRLSATLTVWATDRVIEVNVSVAYQASTVLLAAKLGCRRQQRKHVPSCEAFSWQLRFNTLGFHSTIQ